MMRYYLSDGLGAGALRFATFNRNSIAIRARRFTCRCLRKSSKRS